MADNFLERIAATTRADLAQRKAQVSLDCLREQAAAAPRVNEVLFYLRLKHTQSARLIAEVKRASPSKGVIAETFDPVAQALAYQAGGAGAISVLTEPHFFLGSLDHLRAIRERVYLPVLRKDFILDPYQVYESRAAGADALLLICALLDDATLRDLLALTHALGMEALVEAHDEEETLRAVASGARLIGVNSRDLRTFNVDPDILQRLRPLVPQGVHFVAESGISDALGAARARAWGADAILVGEALMRASDPAAKARELATAPGGGPIHSVFVNAHRPFVKLCGLTTSEQVELAAALGADAYGLNFAPQAPAHRRITPDDAWPLTGRGTLQMTQANEQPGRLRFLRRARAGEPWAIGVFVNQDVREIARVVENVGLDAIQLSGDETPAFCAEVAAFADRPVLKAVRPRSESDLDAMDAYALAGATLLVDTATTRGAGGYGGSGEVGDWSIARTLARRWPIVLAGGLTPDNVAHALAMTGARGVDVSSGIETERVKDPDKMRRFVAAARKTTDQESSVRL